MSQDVIAIFRQLGFVPAREMLRLEIAEDGHRSVMEVVDAASGSLPSAASRSFTVRMINPDLSPGWKGPDCMELRDAVFADVVALVVAESNQVRSLRGDQSSEALLFEHEDMAISNAFADDQYADWQGDLDAAVNVWVLRNPEQSYGESYVAWRGAVVAMAEQGELGPLLEKDRMLDPAPGV